MDKHICKAKRIFDGKWVVGYHVAVPWENDSELAHLIISLDAEYKGSGTFSWDAAHRVDPNTVCNYTGMTEFVVADKSFNEPLFEGDIVEIHSVRCPYAAYPQSKYDGPVKARVVIHFERGMWRLDYKNKYNEKMCEPRGNEQYERSVSNSWELYYFGYHGRDVDKYRELNKRFHYHDIVRLGNIYDNPELLEG
jgi:hypothetical protein